MLKHAAAPCAIFASSCRDDLTVWMLFLLKKRVSKYLPNKNFSQFGRDSRFKIFLFSVRTKLHFDNSIVLSINLILSDLNMI